MKIKTLRLNFFQTITLSYKFNKLIIFAVSLFFLIISCNDNDNNVPQQYEIHGTISGIKENVILLKKISNKKLITVDSAIVSENKFFFKGKNLTSPEMRYLYFPKNRIFSAFFLENNIISVIVKKNKNIKVQITGSKSNNVFASFIENNSIYENKQTELQKQQEKACNSNDNELYSHIDSLLKANRKEQIQYAHKFVSAHTKSNVAVYIALQNLSSFYDVHVLDSIKSSFDKSLTGSKYYVEFNNIIENLHNLEPGKIAPDIALKKLNGKSLLLSEQKGKYILLLFWTSYNKKSVSQLINFSKKYEDLKKFNFEIVSVSLDNYTQNAIKVIDSFDIKGLKTFESDGFESSIVKKYRIIRLPANYLINSKGIIIGKDITVENLEKYFEK